MEQWLLNLIDVITWPGVIALGIIVVLKPIMPVMVEWIRGKSKSRIIETLRDKDGNLINLESLDQKISLLGSNHFHEVKDALNDIRDALRELKAMQKENNDRSLVILTKLNGRNYS